MFKWLNKNERGSVMVIVALSMVVLLGFTGLAVDFGGMAATKSELQNAADAAALAAAQDIKDGRGQSVATLTAKEYITANGFALDNGITEAQITFPSSTTVSVAITTKQDTPFTQLLTGRSTNDVSVLAVAETSKILGGFPYALFAADTINDPISINGNNIYVKGNVHSNGSISMPAATVEGNVTCLGDADINTVNGSVKEDAPNMEMPNGDDLIALGKSGYTFSGNVILKGNKDKPESNQFKDFGSMVAYAASQCPAGPNGLNIYITGTLTQNGNGTAFDNATEYNHPINLIVGGNIDLNGCELTSAQSCPIMLVSENGDVTVNGGGTGYYGVVFAPKGDVELNGGGQGNNPCTFYGSIIAQNITKNGGKINVIYNQFVDDDLTQELIRLIK